MKRSLILFIITLLSSSNSFSQCLNFVGGLTMNSSKVTSHLATYQIGVSNPIITDYRIVVNRTKFRPSFFAGINLNFKVKNKTGISTGLVYINRSLSKATSEYLQHVSVPLNFTYQVLPKFKVLSGPQIDFIVGKGVDIVDKANLSGVLGVQYHPNRIIQFGLNFNTNISHIKYTNYDNRIRFGYNTFMISAGYPI